MWCAQPDLIYHKVSVSYTIFKNCVSEGKITSMCEGVSKNEIHTPLSRTLELPPFATNFVGHLYKYVKQNRYQTNGAWANRYLPRKRQIAFNLQHQLFMLIRFDEFLKGLIWLSKQVQVANSKTTHTAVRALKLSPQGYLLTKLRFLPCFMRFPS